MVDARLDSRTYSEMYDSMKKFEVVEEYTIQEFCGRYRITHGGSVSYQNYGFRQAGLEKDITKTNALPDFSVECEHGPMKKELVEVQGMQYDVNRFHIKTSKFHKALETGAYLIHLSGLKTPNERFVVISPQRLEEFKEKSMRDFGIVSYPGTVCKDFPRGKPAYRFPDSYFKWNYTGKNDLLVIN